MCERLSCIVGACRAGESASETHASTARSGRACVLWRCRSSSCRACALLSSFFKRASERAGDVGHPGGARQPARLVHLPRSVGSPPQQRTLPRGVRTERVSRSACCSASVAFFNSVLADEVVRSVWEVEVRTSGVNLSACSLSSPRKITVSVDSPASLAALASETNSDGSDVSESVPSVLR